MKFSTKDREYDNAPNKNCAKVYEGAWWFQRCGFSHLNGQYLRGNHSSAGKGVFWNFWKGNKYSLKTTTMMIRRA